MKIVFTYLNNYQLGSYAHRVCSQYIIEEKRVNAHATKVVWELPNSELKLLQKALGRKKLNEGDCLA